MFFNRGGGGNHFFVFGLVISYACISREKRGDVAEVPLPLHECVTTLEWLSGEDRRRLLSAVLTHGSYRWTSETLHLTCYNVAWE